MSESDSTKEYNEFYRDNLPEGVTYNSTLARYFYEGKRFITIKSVEWFRTYIVKTFPTLWFLFTGVWDTGGQWDDAASWE